MRLIDLTGNRYGSLVVIKRDTEHRVKNKRTFWLCKCDCGNNTVVDGQKLKAGTTKSCGCKYHWRENFNEVREDNDTVCIKVKGREVIVDKEDFNKIYPHKVCINGNGYAVFGRNQFVHRTIIDCPKGYMVDHINHNQLDNRKCNLRIVTNSENQVNKKIMSNTGEYGITLCKDGRYRVTVDDVYRGLRYTLNDAIALRNESLKGTRQERLNYYLQEGVSK